MVISERIVLGVEGVLGSAAGEDKKLGFSNGRSSMPIYGDSIVDETLVSIACRAGGAQSFARRTHWAGAWFAR
jgi:hypothetical protein